MVKEVEGKSPNDKLSISQQSGSELDLRLWTLLPQRNCRNGNFIARCGGGGGGRRRGGVFA